MSKQVEPLAPRDDSRWVRPAWIVLMILFGASLLFNLYQWLRGGGRADGLLVPAAFLFMGLPYVLRLTGTAQKVLLAVSVSFAVLALIMFIRILFIR